jgi:hypothetical protein
LVDLIQVLPWDDVQAVQHVERALGCNADTLAPPVKDIAAVVDHLEVDLYRAQAVETWAYEPDLAAALNNRAIRLAGTGDRAGAVAPAQEAVHLYQQLVIDEPFRQANLDWAQQALDGLLHGPE